MEVGGIVKSELAGNVLNGAVGGDEHGFSHLNLAPSDVGEGCGACLLAELANEMVFRQVGVLRQLLYADHLAYVGVDVLDGSGDALVLDGLNGGGGAEESGQEYVEYASRLDFVAKGALLAEVDILHERLVVVVGGWVALGQGEDAVDFCHRLEEVEVGGGVGWDFSEEVEVGEVVEALDCAFNHVDVVVLEGGVADVAVEGERRYEIQVVGAQGDGFFALGGCGVDYDFGFALGDVVEAGEGAAHVLPVPVGFMLGISCVECQNMEVVDVLFHCLLPFLAKV